MNLKYLNAINLAFGPQRARGLLRRFGSTEKVWAASVSKLKEVGISPEHLTKILERRESVQIEKAWQALTEQKIELVSIENRDYPDILKQTPSPPLALYLKGNKNLLKKPALAIVGTRTPSSYGKTIIPGLIEPLCRAGLVIISGLAQGIDALAHQATLNCAGQTIAIMGRGLDRIFPNINAQLGRDIIEKNGLIVSEYALGTPPLKQHFPARNRIIAGLAAGVLVVESRSPGGALITARQALEANREVFALPGPIHLATSQGTNELIQQGAKLVLKAEDILEELTIPLQKHLLKDTLEKLTPREKLITQILQTEPLHIDNILRQAKLTPSETGSILTSLELKGVIKNIGGNIWQQLL